MIEHHQALRTLFPEDFVWGVGTSAVQIEGAATADGKGESVWDRFAAERKLDSPAVACGHYDRYRDDVQLIRDLGIDHYRFSISWPRIMPDGVNVLDDRGLSFYDRLVDALLEKRITPWATLFHWDLPQALEDRGGWPARGTVDAFGSYSELVVRRLGDRVRNWFTINEAPSFIGLGYGNGTNAPGRFESPQVLNQAYHHALLAHGHCVRAVREFAKGARVGIVHNPEIPIPIFDTALDIAAARDWFRRESGQILGSLYGHPSFTEFLERAGDDAPDIRSRDLEFIAQPTDFIGLNVYTGKHVRRGEDGKAVVLPLPADYPTAAGLPWLKIAPEALYWATRFTSDVYGPASILIAENGLCCNDESKEGDQIADVGRVEYLRACIAALGRGKQENLPINGYFLWSLLDNYEWAEGYKPRFGIVHVDYKTLARTAKLSARWYSKLIRLNPVY